MVWNKGLTKEVDERVKKNALSRMGQKRPTVIGNKFSINNKPNKSSFKEKHIPWNKGTKYSKEYVMEHGIGLNPNSHKGGFKKGNKCGALKKPFSGEMKRNIVDKSRETRIKRYGAFTNEDIIKRTLETRKNYKPTEETRGKTSFSLKEFYKTHDGSNKGKTNLFKQTEEAKKRISQKHNGMKASDDSRRKMRESKIKYIMKMCKEGQSIGPTIGGHETEILNHLEKIHNVRFERQYIVAGYFLDGYCIEKNIVVEIDEKYHEKQKEYDMKRQKEIQKELNCNFIRIPDYFINIVKGGN